MGILGEITNRGTFFYGRVDGLEGFLLAVGMCGQGFMFGPGVGQLLTNLVMDNLEEVDQVILDSLSYHRQFDQVERLK